MPEPARRGRRPPRRLRCETCLDVLTLRHAWDVATCSCGALMVSGRPATPVVHWLSRPGGGWSEVSSDAAGEVAASDPSPPPAGPSRRRIGYAGRLSPADW